MLIDTHCHLDFEDFNTDRDLVINHSKDEGIGCIINVGSSLNGTKASIELAERFDFIYASAGLHPHEADKVSSKDLDIFKKYIDEGKHHIVAIGEIGLDYFKNFSSKEAQRGLFIKLLEEAKLRGLPVIIHSREAGEDTLLMIKDIFGKNCPGVMHCFSGDKTLLEKCLDIGLYISFTCNITFKNAASLRDVVKLVPMDRLLLETDAPYLAPQALRGKRNEPGFLKYLAEEISRIKNISIDEVARITTSNAKLLFNLRKSL